MTLGLEPDGGGLALRRDGRGGLAVDALMTGRPVAEARRLLPAIFGLCRPVQDWALALALDLPERPEIATLRRDMLRDHLAKLCLHLPRRLGLAPLPLPANWAIGGAKLREALFGAETLPSATAFPGWTRSEGGLAPLARAVAQSFAPGEARVGLPPLDIGDPLADGPVENSLSLRHAGHPLLARVQADWGPGPLASLVARLIDLDALSRGEMPAPRRLADGTALVPCSRGLCALRMRQAGGMVTAFTRRTPTDHLLAPGGALEVALRHLPPEKSRLAPLVVELLDPCLPLRLTEPGHA